MTVYTLHSYPVILRPCYGEECQKFQELTHVNCFKLFSKNLKGFTILMGFFNIA